MASWEEGSFDPDFVDSKASKEFTCSICLSLAVQPRLNPSCGHHYCRPCTEKLVGKGQPCPECRADITNPVPDLYFERQMKHLKVHCLGKKTGCRWIGKLAELQNHLEGCPLIPVKCDFSYAGCTAAVARRDLKKHMQESLSVHIGLLCKEVQQKGDELAALKTELETAKMKSQAAKEKIERLEQQLASPSALATPEFVMTNFEEHKAKEDNGQWYSPPFYSHVGGYKMCLRVCANGQATGKGTHVSVYVHMMQGENDDHLKWPFSGSITVKLLNHRALNGSGLYTVQSTSSAPDSFAGRVVGRLRSQTGIGCDRFKAHSDLPYNSTKNTEYLINDSLTLSIAKVDLT